MNSLCYIEANGDDAFNLCIAYILDQERCENDKVTYLIKHARKMYSYS